MNLLFALDSQQGQLRFYSVVFSNALRQWRRGNIALITTQPVLECLNLVKRLQPRCLEESFLPFPRTDRTSRFRAASLDFDSPKCRQMTCSITIRQPRKHSLVTVEQTHRSLLITESANTFAPFVSARSSGGLPTGPTFLGILFESSARCPDRKHILCLLLLSKTKAPLAFLFSPEFLHWPALCSSLYLKYIASHSDPWTPWKMAWQMRARLHPQRKIFHLTM